jgi:hypothetical protein
VWDACATDEWVGGVSSELSRLGKCTWAEQWRFWATEMKWETWVSWVIRPKHKLSLLYFFIFCSLFGIPISFQIQI